MAISSAPSWKRLLADTLGTQAQGPLYERIRRALWTAVGYSPTESQDMVLSWLNPQGTICQKGLVEGGIQSGKSTIIAADVIGRLPWLCGEEVWITGPDFTQGRKECEYLIEWSKKLGLFDPGQSSLPNSDAAPWRILLRNGTLIKTFSGLNYRKMAASTPGYVALVEPGQMPDAQPMQIGLARANLKGVPFRMVGTLEGSTNWYASTAERWEKGTVPGSYAWKLPTWTNTAMFPGGRYDPLILAAENDPDLSRETFLERYAGERCAPPGLVFGRTQYHPGFDPLLHVHPIRRRQPLEGDAPDTIYLPPAAPLYLAIDPGWDHPYGALLCAIAGHPRSIYVLDELKVRGASVSTMIRMARARWAEEWPRIVMAALDPASRQHHGEVDYTHRDMWAAPPPLGAGLATWAEERVSPQWAIQAIRTLLEVNPGTQLARLTVDSSTVHLQWEFREGYRNRMAYGENTGEPIPKNEDLIKALGYLLKVQFPQTGMLGQRRAMKDNGRCRSGCADG